MWITLFEVFHGHSVETMLRLAVIQNYGMAIAHYTNSTKLSLLQRRAILEQRPSAIPLEPMPEEYFPLDAQLSMEETVECQTMKTDLSKRKLSDEWFTEHSK